MAELKEPVFKKPPYQPSNCCQKTFEKSSEKADVLIKMSASETALAADTNNNSVFPCVVRSPLNDVLFEKPPSIIGEIIQRSLSTFQKSRMIGNSQRRESKVTDPLPDRHLNVESHTTKTSLASDTLGRMLNPAGTIRGLKRKWSAVDHPRRLLKKFKNVTTDLKQHDEGLIVDYQNNQCRSLIPYVSTTSKCFELNEHLKCYLEQKPQITSSSNTCRTVVPYVKRVSLLENHVCRNTSSAPVINALQPDVQTKDTPETTSLRSQNVLFPSPEEENYIKSLPVLVTTQIQGHADPFFKQITNVQQLDTNYKHPIKNIKQSGVELYDKNAQIMPTELFPTDENIEFNLAVSNENSSISMEPFDLFPEIEASQQTANTVATSNTCQEIVKYIENRSYWPDLENPSCIVALASRGLKRKLKLRSPFSHASIKKIRTVRAIGSYITENYATVSIAKSTQHCVSDSSTSIEALQCQSPISYFVSKSIQQMDLNFITKNFSEDPLLTSSSGNNCRALAPFVKRVSLLEAILSNCSAIEHIATSSQLSTGRTVSFSKTLSWGDEDVDFTDHYDSVESEEEFYTAKTDVAMVRSIEQPQNKSVDQPLHSNNSTVAVYYRIHSFWNQNKYDELLQAKRRGQVIRIQRNKRYRFIPYDRNNRKQRRACPFDGDSSTWIHKLSKQITAEPPTSSQSTSSVEHCPTTKSADTSLALIPYAGNPILSAIHEQISTTLKSFVFHSELTGYLTFCSNVDCQSTMILRRGLKRKLERDNILTGSIVSKKFKGSDSSLTESSD
ncbi:uncharacterized protein LOC131681581 [Topomyia yanbarensis]|uniref:uncharacterized protein LOC131681581 n=1 Tax=Topomyia yanbarensis TaxID=2498891 RepID=UPI00273B511D|nr:uncharacterized protein LOC131681581 [Topomyia yanbarensis]